LKRRHLLELGRFRCQPLEQWEREHAPAVLRSALHTAVVAVADAVEARGVANRQGPQHHGVDQRENGRGAADAQRERENGGGGEHA
jgi:hypothetical protein